MGRGLTSLQRERSLNLSRIKTFAFLILLPLALSLLPVVQLHRVQVNRQEEPDLRARMEGAQRELAGATEPGAAQRVAEARAWHTRELHAAKVAENARLPERELLARIGLGAAIAALLAGAFLFWRLLQDGRRARASFASLMASLEGGWRSVSRGVLLQVALMFAALLAAGLYEVSWSVSNYASVGWIPVLFLLPVWSGVLACARLLWRSFRSLTPPDPLYVGILGRALSRDDAPAVWAWVSAIAERLQAPAPDHLVIGLARGFFVTGARALLHPSRQRLEGRTLYLPLTYLNVLSREEASAIVGHELGHFAGRDTEHGAQLSLAFRQMEHGVALLAEQQDEAPSVFNLPALWTTTTYLDQLEAAYLHFSREQELRADALGAKATGAAAMASALLRVTALEEHVERAVERSEREAGRDVISELLQDLETEPLSLSDTLLQRTLPHPIDTHPPTAARIEALRLPVSPALLARAIRRPDAADTAWFQSLLDAHHQVA